MKLLNYILVFVLLCYPVVSIGISPPRMEIGNAGKGETIEKTFFMSDINVGERIDFKISGDMQDWINLDPRDGTIVQKDTKRIPIKLSITVPKDIPNGYYASDIIVRAVPEELGGEDTIVSIVSGVRLVIDLEVSGEEVIDYTVKTIELDEAFSEQPIIMHMIIENNGNVYSGPDEVEILVYDRENNLVLEDFLEITGYSKPHSTTPLRVEVPSNLQEGDYRTEFYIYDDSEIVYETEIMVQMAGDSLPSAEFMDLLVPALIIAGDDLKTVAKVKNDGTKPIEVILTGELTDDDRIIESFRSDPVKILPGDIQDISAYVKDMAAGSGTIRGQIIFNGYKTDAIERAFICRDSPDKITGGFVSRLTDRLSSTPLSIATIISVIVIQVIVVLVLLKIRK